MFEAIGVLATIVAVFGVILNNRMSSACFYVWMVSNLMSLGLHLHGHMWSLAGRDAIFFLLCIHGLVKWRRKRGS